MNVKASESMSGRGALPRSMLSTSASRMVRTRPMSSCSVFRSSIARIAPSFPVFGLRLRAIGPRQEGPLGPSLLAHAPAKRGRYVPKATADVQARDELHAVAVGEGHA